MVEIPSVAFRASATLLRVMMHPLRQWFSWRSPRVAIAIGTKRKGRPEDVGRKLEIRVTNRSQRNISVKEYRVIWLDQRARYHKVASFDQFTPGSAKNRFGGVLRPGECEDLSVYIFPEWSSDYFIRDAILVQIYADGYASPAEAYWRWKGA